VWRLVLLTWPSHLLDLDGQLLNLRNEALLFGEGGDESSKPRTSQVIQHRGAHPLLVCCANVYIYVGVRVYPW
jgi:hypothetical protein